MIPKVLTLKNFTSYGDSVLPLNFEEFHLACLSGTNGAGKSSILDAITYAIWGEARGKSPDDLVKIDEQKMEVEFEFSLEGDSYRVARSRDKKRQATELSYFSQGKKRQWINLSEGTIKETQFKIDSLLKMTYETFINSAFLRQGRADEFTLKGPSDRKRILGEILGLQVYDELEARARDKTRQSSQELIRVETQLGEIENELGQAEIRQDQMEKAQEKVAEIEGKLKDLEEIVKTERDEKGSFLIIRSNRQQIEKQGFEIKRQINETRIQIQREEQAGKELDQILARADEIQSNYRQFKELREKIETLNEKSDQLRRLGDRRLAAQNLYHKKSSELEAKLSGLKSKLEDIKKQGIKIGQDLEQSKKAQAKCPLCGNLLVAGHQKEAVDKLTNQQTEKRREYQAINDQLKALESQKPNRDELDKLEEEIRRLDYDESGHKEIKIALSKLGRIEEEKSALDSSQATYQAHQKNLDEKKGFLAQQQKLLEENEKSLGAIPAVESKLDEIETSLDQHQKEQRILLEEEREARSVLGEAKGLVARSTQLGELKKKRLKEREKLAQTKEIFEELALAFGKKGIQAMLIETAVPEIEEEANRLLDKLTDGHMRVLLQTQRDTKKGDTVETLDIIISDELGSRPYEMYSGGETFRVNFALRLALSKLLTHRAGTKLQFLVIDEGFGTQDTRGRERLVEIINEIKQDFEKILVITHIEELKEMFPVRIEIEKGLEGSNYKIVGT